MNDYSSWTTETVGQVTIVSLSVDENESKHGVSAGLKPLLLTLVRRATTAPAPPPARLLRSHRLGLVSSQLLKEPPAGLSEDWGIIGMKLNG